MYNVHCTSVQPFSMDVASQWRVYKWSFYMAQLFLEFRWFDEYICIDYRLPSVDVDSFAHEKCIFEGETFCRPIVNVLCLSTASLRTDDGE